MGVCQHITYKVIWSLYIENSLGGLSSVNCSLIDCYDTCQEALPSVGQTPGGSFRWALGALSVMH